MKKAQSLAIAVISILVITVAFIQIFIAQYEAINSQEDDFKAVSDEAIRIGGILSGPSAPSQWTSIDEVKKIGLLKGGVIEEATLSQYKNMEYSKSKLLLGTSMDYMFFFKNDSGLLPIDGYEFWGWNPNDDLGNGGDDVGANLDLVYSFSKHIGKNENLVRIKFPGDNNPVLVKMYVYTWR